MIDLQQEGNTLFEWFKRESIRQQERFIVDGPARTELFNDFNCKYFGIICADPRLHSHFFSEMPFASIETIRNIGAQVESGDQPFQSRLENKVLVTVANDEYLAILVTTHSDCRHFDGNMSAALKIAANLVQELNRAYDKVRDSKGKRRICAFLIEIDTLEGSLIPHHASNPLGHKEKHNHEILPFRLLKNLFENDKDIPGNVIGAVAYLLEKNVAYREHRMQGAHKLIQAELRPTGTIIGVGKAFNGISDHGDLFVIGDHTAKYRAAVIDAIGYAGPENVVLITSRISHRQDTEKEPFHKTNAIARAQYIADHCRNIVDQAFPGSKYQWFRKQLKIVPSIINRDTWETTYIEAPERVLVHTHS